MATPHKIKDIWTGVGAKAKKLVDWMNQVGKFCNLIEGLSPVHVQSTGPSIAIGLEDGYIAVPEPPAEGFYQLTSQDGVLTWVLVVDCDETPASP